jgi:hypothetical protein
MTLTRIIEYSITSMASNIHPNPEARRAFQALESTCHQGEGRATVVDVDFMSDSSFAQYAGISMGSKASL